MGTVFTFGIVCAPETKNDTNFKSRHAISANMPSSNAPEEWQCTDVPALKHLPKNRSCLAYDSSNGYTYQDGKCVTSDYNGCIDTYNKFKNMETCSLSMTS